MHDKPFNVRPNKRGPTQAWALKIMNAWRKLGYPSLIGPPAEQVQLARSLGVRE